MSSKKKNKNNQGEVPSIGQAQSASTKPAHITEQRSAPQQAVQSQRSATPTPHSKPTYPQHRPSTPSSVRASGRPRIKKPFDMAKLVQSRAFQLLVVLVIAALPSLYFYHASRQAEQMANGPSSSNLQTTAAVVKQVSRHILLPSGEQPTVATVSDASKVRGQAFFANAASGDKVLVYAQAKKAYLYRPSIDRIIEVAPLAPNKTGP